MTSPCRNGGKDRAGTSTAAMENSVEISLKTGNRTAI